LFAIVTGIGCVRWILACGVILKSSGDLHEFVSGDIFLKKGMA
jgi:hypothetical protein